MSAGPINLITFNCVSSRSSEPNRSNSFPSPPPFLQQTLTLPLSLLENERPVGGRLSSRSDSIQFRQSADKIRSGEKYGGPRFRFYVGSHQRREARAFMPRLQRARRFTLREGYRERERERKAVLEGREEREGIAVYVEAGRPLRSFDRRHLCKSRRRGTAGETPLETSPQPLPAG